jgi:hypothetical protein
MGVIISAIALPVTKLHERRQQKRERQIARNYESTSTTPWDSSTRHQPASTQSAPTAGSTLPVSTATNHKHGVGRHTSGSAATADTAHREEFVGNRRIIDGAFVERPQGKSQFGDTEIPRASTGPLFLTTH